MTTVADLIVETQRLVHGTQRTEINVLAAAVNSSTTTITIEDAAGGITERSVISIDDELMYVRAVSGTSLTVIRGYRSTAAAHDDGKLIEVNPRFPQVMIRRALIDDIHSWPDSVYREQTQEYSLSTSEVGIDLDDFATVRRILDVEMAATDNLLFWQRPYRTRLLTAADPGDFPSGNGLIVYPADFRSYPTTGSSTYAVRVTAATDFVTSTFTDAIDVVTTVGLPATAIDIPPLGAAARLVGVREILRTNMGTQNQPRRAEEVPAGATIQTGLQLMQLRDRRLSQEATRLMARWGVRKS